MINELTTEAIFKSLETLTIGIAALNKKVYDLELRLRKLEAKK